MLWDVGTQKNRLNETVLLSTKHMFKLVDKKIIIKFTLNFLLNSWMKVQNFQKFWIFETPVLKFAVCRYAH